MKVLTLLDATVIIHRDKPIDMGLSDMAIDDGNGKGLSRGRGRSESVRFNSMGCVLGGADCFSEEEERDSMLESLNTVFVMAKQPEV